MIGEWQTGKKKWSEIAKMDFSDLFRVTIDFSQSHLFFPKIIHWVLLIQFFTIVVFVARPYLCEVMAGTKQLPFTKGHFDSFRFFGTIVLTIVYFLSMDFVGEFFPNTGLGFLLMSIPYMFLLSLLYVHHRDRRRIIIIALNSVLAPIIAWYVLARLFSITLP